MAWSLTNLFRRRFVKPAPRKPFRRGRRPALERLEDRLAPANVNVTSFHYDPFIQGQDTQESDLTPLNVNSTLFGKLASASVDGYTYAQPLYVHGVMIGGVSHDVAFVSTEHDSVYAFDIVKNATTGAVTVTQLWQHSFISSHPASAIGPTTSGITTITNFDGLSPNHDIQPEIGITGSPVIDFNSTTGSGTLYVVAKTEEVGRGDNLFHFVQRLHALDLATGADKYITTGDGGYVIGDTGVATFANNAPPVYANETTAIKVPGHGAENSNPSNPSDPNAMVAFSALRENQRPSLQLLNGRVYVAWASHGDTGPYHGWVVGFNETTLQPEKIFNTSPNGGLSGIWQSEGAISTDGRYLYFAVGNGGGANGIPAFSPSNGNYSESVLKIDTGTTDTIMPVADYFTPFNWASLDSADADLGSGGVMLLPDSVGSTAHPHLMIETGKDGHIYLLDRDNLGKLSSGQNNNQIVQDVVAGPGGVWGNPSFYQESSTSGLLIYHGSGSDTRMFRISNGQITQITTGNVIAYRSNQTFGFPGAQPVISANGTSNPSSLIDWELQTDNFGSQGAAVLHAYALPTVSGVVQSSGTLTELYNSNQSGTRDQLSASVKFTSAITTNGLVFVAQGGAGVPGGNPATGTFNVFGLFPPPTQAPVAPTGLAAQGLSTTQIQLSWTNPPPQPGAQATAIQIFRSVGNDQNFGTTPLTTVAANATTFTDTVTDPNQIYFYKIRAHNVIGDSSFSNEASASPFIQPVLSLVNVASNVVSLVWTRPPVANNRFNVERSTTADFSGTVTTIATGLSTNTTSYLDTDSTLVTSPGTYYYRIRAFSTAAATPFALSNVVGVKVGPQAGVINYPNGTPVPPAPAPFDLTANGSAQFADASRLTNAPNQTGSIFSTSEENILNWTTTFEVRLHEGTQPYYANGFAFVIQANGANALGQGLTGLGYQGIGNSVALTFDTFTNGFGQTGSTNGGAVGLFVNGHNPGGTVGAGETRILLDASQGVNLDSQRDKIVTLSYAYNPSNPSASVLHEVITDTVTSAMFTHDYTVDIPSLLGLPANGNTIAYVGFTGSTGSVGGPAGQQQALWELQDIVNWVYTPTGPAAPHGLTVTSSPSANALSWKTTSADDQGYYVERATSLNGTFTRIQTLGAGVTTYNDTGLTVPTQYYYRVQQFNHNGSGGAELDSGYSNYATGALIDVAFPNFADHTTVAANGNTTFPTSPSVLRLTSNVGGQASSAWYTAAIGTGVFSTTFTLQDQPNGNPADSVSFVIQNDPRGTTALGGGGGGGGYQGITNSIAIKFDLWNHGNHQYSTGLFTGGQAPDSDTTKDVPLAPVNLNSGDPLLVTLTYDGATLTETVTDTVTGQTFGPKTYALNLTQVIGGSTAFVGFTGGTGGAQATQDIVSWSGQFMAPLVTPIPPRLEIEPLAAATAGVQFQLTVRAVDANGATNTGYTGTVHFVSSDGKAVLPSNYTFAAADNGVKTFNVTLNTVAGAQSITVYDTAQNKLVNSTFVAVNPGPTSTFSVTGFPALLLKGGTGTFTVTATDAFGNTTPAYTGTINLTSSDKAATFTNGDGTPLAGNNYTFTAADKGTHTFKATLNTVGTQSITATDTVTMTINGTEKDISVQEAGFVTIDFSGGFDAHGSVTANGSASFPANLGPVGAFAGHQDIGTQGNPSPAGSATFNSATGAYTLTASGSDIWDTADHMQYVYEPLVGNGEIVARITSATAQDFWTKAGVMIRTDLTPGSPDDFVLYTPFSMPGNDHREPVMQFRDGYGQGTADTRGGGVVPAQPTPIWLRLNRTGNVFTGYWAVDVSGAPGAWQQFPNNPHTTVMPTTVFVGLALTSHNNGAVASATFDHVTVTGNTTGTVPPAVLRLTDGGNSEAGSAFYNIPVSTGAFTTTFTLRDHPVNGGGADDLLFVIQNDPRALTALGDGGGSGGYGPNNQIVNSIAIKFDIWHGGDHAPTTGLYVNGQSPTSPNANDVPVTGGLNFLSGDPIKVTLTYDGAVLTEVLTDTLNTSLTFTKTYTINIPQTIGGYFAYAGFTGGTGGASAVQDIVNWTGTFLQAGTVQFNFPTFADHSSLTANANAQSPPINVFPSGTPAVLQMTDNRGGEATSAFYNFPVGVGPFSTAFTLQDSGGADGLSFVIQADPRGNTALGDGGGGEGYAGIANSIAVKFDLFHTSNGFSTTGLFTGGANPGNGPHVEMTNINLGSGHSFQVTLTYDGAMLTETVKDTVTNQTFSKTYSLNLAQVIGGNSAYVGFTAGTGGVASTQKVLNWSGQFTPALPTKFLVSAPATDAIGTPISVTVTPVDRNNAPLPGYFGTVHFTSSDTTAALPADYTFKPASDTAGHAFSLTLNTVGANTTGGQSITVTDSKSTVTAITGTATVNALVDFSGAGGFVNTGDLMVNGNAAFVGPVTPVSPLGIFANHQNIGTPGDPAQGGATFSNGAYTLTSSGSDIWNAADHMQYVYEPLVGNGEIIARVVNPENAPDFWTKAGVMFRTDLSAGSQNVFMMYTPNTGHQEPVLQWRDNAGNDSGDTGNHPPSATSPNVPVPIWLRLVRNGNTFTGYWATDNNGTPNTWQLLANGDPHTTNMPTTVYVGLALTKNGAGTLATATFDHVQVIGTTAPLVTSTVARITDGGNGEANSLFTKTKVYDASFTTTFTLKDQAVNAGGADDLLFVLQNDSRGATAVGGGGGSGGFTGVTPSIGIKFDIWTNGSHVPTTGLFINGETPSTNEGANNGQKDILVTGGFNFLNGDPIQVTLRYNGTTLTESLLDTVTGATFTYDYLVDIPTILGGSTAYAGFTGSTGGASAIQDLLSWKYQPIPVPAVASLSASLTLTPNLVTNGGFETGNFNGWTLDNGFGPGEANVITYASLDNAIVHSGTHSGQFGPGGIGNISQTLATTPGVNYNLDFWLANPEDGGGTEWYVKLGGNTLIDVTNAPRFNYTHYSFTFTATSSSTPLQFGFKHPPDWFYLDDVSVTPTSLVAGTNATTTVTALDAGGHRVAYTGTVHITTTDPQIPSFGNYTFTAADNGQHAFTGTLVTAGARSVSFTDTVNPALTATANVIISPAAANSFLVTANPSTVTAGNSTSVTVTAKDAFGNTATGYTGTVHFMSSDGKAVLPADSILNAGVGTFSVTLKTVNPAGGQTVKATDTVAGSITGMTTVTVNPAAASAFTVAGFPSPITAGTPGSFTVTAKDPYDNVATGYTGTAHFTSSDNNPSTILPVDYIFMAADKGQHAFSATLTTAGTQSLTATDTVTPSITGTQSGIVVNPAAAASFAISAPSTATAGSSITVTVTALDAFGNTATGYSGTVHLSSSDGQAVLPADATLTNGVGAFSVILETVNVNPPGTQTVTAADTVNSSLTATANVTVNPAAATHFLLTFPSTVTRDQPNDLIVVALDAFGNVATGYTGKVTFSSSDDNPNVALPADYTFTAADGGTHTFSGVSLHGHGQQSTESITATDTLDASIFGTIGVMVLNQGGQAGASPGQGGK